MRVLVVIVTFNRRKLLEKCLNSIFSQIGINLEILVVDNASEDDTVDFLNKKYSKNIILLSLNKNVGGAGGFNVGMDYAKNLNYDWVWLMDDDGYPDEKCLVYLLDYANKNDLDAISPVQLDIENTEYLAFPLTYKGKKIDGKHKNISDMNFIENEANLFNGLLIRRSIINKIGLPKAELFIRGDEVEYTKRFKKHNIKFGTLVEALFFHPSDINERIQVLFGLWTIRDAHSDFKNYYMFRNRAVAFIEDGNALLLPLDFIRYSYYFLIHKKCNWKGLKLWCTATYDGIKGKLGRHPKY